MLSFLHIVKIAGHKDNGIDLLKLCHRMHFYYELLVLSGDLKFYVST